MGGCAGKKGPQAEKQQRRAQAKEQRRLKAAGKGDGSQPAKHRNAFMEVPNLPSLSFTPSMNP